MTLWYKKRKLARAQAGGYTEDRPTILMYWRVVEGFTENQKRLLLKFITSCSRPSLLGFKELFPPISIGNAGADIRRLPSASTCMNLLKLPQYPNDDLLSTKLLYAIESDAGFELS
ncbi:PREDICTED: ubiquitin-protein ligase E3C-like [Priapulus caudatus]|uniref:HECT-type E3 ubiquitin transferase n=1 Tax=Priapulus caudatus TaxID=37621 RepID=A0ABM1E5A8_PRICU|nr:PREDICTED: ubiquitin-protein ligase E3C-like [Priapulus caudatus]